MTSERRSSSIRRSSLPKLARVRRAETNCLLHLVLNLNGKAAYYQCGEFKGSERNPVLRIGDLKAQDGRGKEIIQAYGLYD
jgi:hypothetical protein